MTDPISFTIHATTMKRALAFASQATERRNTIPILGMINVEFHKNRMIITGTDLDVECSAWAETITGGNAPFGFTISPRLLAGCLRYAEGEVTITKQDDIVTIKADDMEAEVREICPPSDWPFMDLGKLKPQPTSISEDKLRKAMETAAICISTEETRYYLNGVFMHDKGEGLICVATDGHRLARYETGESWGLPAAIFPRKAAAILTAAVKRGANGNVYAAAFSAEPEKVMARNKAGLATGKIIDRPAHLYLEFRGEGWCVRSRTIDGTYPDYTRVIPQRQKEPEFKATISAAAVRRFPNTDHRSQPLRIDPASGKMWVSTPEGFSMNMPVQGCSKAPAGFNLSYVQSLAKCAGTIIMESMGAADPALVITDDPAITMVLMPMSL